MAMKVPNGLNAQLLKENAALRVRDTGPAGPSFSISVIGRVNNPTYGPSAQIGTEITATAENWSEAPPASVGWLWLNAVGSPTNEASYTPVPGDDLNIITPRAIPSDIYQEKNGPSSTVRYAPPTSAGALPDVNYTQGTGPQTVNASVDFTGGGITYSVSSSIAGVTIDDNTGIVTIPTTNEVSGTVTVTGTSSGGTAQSGFTATIAESAGTIPTVLTDTLDFGDGDIITLSEPRLVFNYPDGSFGVISTGGDVVVTADLPAVTNDEYGKQMHGMMLIADMMPQYEGVVGINFQGLDETAGINDSEVSKPTYAASYDVDLNKAPSLTTIPLTIALAGGFGGAVKMKRRPSRPLSGGQIDNSELIEKFMVIHCVPSAQPIGTIAPPLMGPDANLNMSDVDFTRVAAFDMPDDPTDLSWPTLEYCVDYMSVQQPLTFWEGETRRGMCYERDYARSILNAITVPASMYMLHPSTPQAEKDILLAGFLTHANNAYGIQDDGGFQRGGAGQSGVDHYILALIAALCPSKPALMAKSQVRLSNLNDLSLWIRPEDIGVGGRYKSRPGEIATNAYHHNQPPLPEKEGEPEWVIEALDRNNNGVFHEENNTFASARYRAAAHSMIINSFCILGLVQDGLVAVMGPRNTWNTSNRFAASLPLADLYFTCYQSHVFEGGIEDLQTFLYDIWVTHRPNMPYFDTPEPIWPMKPIQLANETLDQSALGMPPVYANTLTGFSYDFNNVLLSREPWTGSPDVYPILSRQLRKSHDMVMWTGPIEIGVTGEINHTGQWLIQERRSNAQGYCAWTTNVPLLNGEYISLEPPVLNDQLHGYMGGAEIPVGAPVNVVPPQIHSFAFNDDNGWPIYEPQTDPMLTSKTKLVAGAGIWQDGIDQTIQYQWQIRDNGGAPSDITDANEQVWVRSESELSGGGVTREVACFVTVGDGHGNFTSMTTNWVEMPEAGAVEIPFDTDPSAITFSLRSGTYEWKPSEEVIRVTPALGVGGFSGVYIKIEGVAIGQLYDLTATISARAPGNGTMDGQVSQDASFTGADPTTNELGSSAGVGILGDLTAQLTPTSNTVYMSVRLRGEIAGGYWFEVTNVSATPVQTATIPGTMSPPTLSAPAPQEIQVDLAAAPPDGGSPILSYDLQWQEDGGNWTLRTSIADPESITGLNDSTLHHVQTRAVNNIGNGLWSTSASISTLGVPSMMDPPVVTSTGQTSLSVELAEDPPDNGSPITGYDVQWSIEGDNVWEIIADTGTTQVISDLTADTSYEVQTRAKNATGNGPWSLSTVQSTDPAPSSDVFYDDFSTDTTANYTSIKLGIVGYNGTTEQITVDNGGDIWFGAATPEIPLEIGETYLIEAELDMTDCTASSGDFSLGYMLAGNADDIGASNPSVGFGQVGITSYTLVSASQAQLYVVPRGRGDPLGQVRCNWIRVTKQ